MKNIVERALIESRGQDIGPEHLHLAATSVVPAQTVEEAIGALPLDFREVELGLMERALKEADGNISAAARLLNVERTKVYRRLKEAGRLTR